MAKKEIRVVGAVIVRVGKVLAARRGFKKTLPGLWEFPGGKIEPGESPQEALVREIREELMCKVEIGAEITTTSHEYDFGVVTLTTFYAALSGSEPRRTEHEEIRWIAVSDLLSVRWTPADIPAIERIMSDFHQAGSTLSQ